MPVRPENIAQRAPRLEPSEMALVEFLAQRPEQCRRLTSPADLWRFAEGWAARDVTPMAPERLAWALQQDCRTASLGVRLGTADSTPVLPRPQCPAFGASGSTDGRRPSAAVQTAGVPPLPTSLIDPPAKRAAVLEGALGECSDVPQATAIARQLVALHGRSAELSALTGTIRWLLLDDPRRLTLVAAAELQFLALFDDAPPSPEVATRTAQTATRAALEAGAALAPRAAARLVQVEQKAARLAGQTPSAAGGPCRLDMGAPVPACAQAAPVSAAQAALAAVRACLQAEDGEPLGIALAACRHIAAFHAEASWRRREGETVGRYFSEFASPAVCAHPVTQYLLRQARRPPSKCTIA